MQVGSVTRHDNRRFSRASRHSWQSGSALLPAYARGGPQIHSADSSSSCIPYGRTMRGRQAGRHGCSNNCLFLPLPVRSLIPARAKRAGNDAMRLCAMVAICTARPSASPFFRPDALAALINRAAQTSGSHHSVHAPCSVVCSFAFTVAAASFLNPVTVRK